MSTAWLAAGAACDIGVDEDPTRPLTWNISCEPKDPEAFAKLVQGLRGVEAARWNAASYSRFSPQTAGLSDKFRNADTAPGYVRSIEFYDADDSKTYADYLAGLE